MNFLVLLNKFTLKITCGLVILLPTIPAFSQKEFVTRDEVYDKNIKTVLLHPATGSNTATLTPPIIPLVQNPQLLLEFDEIGTQYKNYYIKLINCNADWTISSLSSIQYMEEYNELFINDRQVSIGTRTPYIHYKVIVPKVKLSGNYIIKIYKDYNEDDFIISKRFCVFDNIAGIFPEVKFSIDPSARNTHQQVDFTIDYSKIDVINPLQNIQVIVRQNHRWDKVITNLKPVTVNEQIRRLEYFYFNRENNFKGGNEFRIIDIKSSNFSGFNVQKTKRDSNRAEAFVYPEKSRAQEAYVQPLLADFDGKYFIENYESGDGQTYADYMYVTFTLDVQSPVNGKVYILGGMTDWKLDKNFEMTFDPVAKKYTCQTLLKQGVYNYMYVVGNPSTQQFDEYYFEGSYSLTQNQYDILVYYRPFGSRSDLLIGYKNVNYLGRR